jgi:hypothetical protein
MIAIKGSSSLYCVDGSGLGSSSVAGCSIFGFCRHRVKIKYFTNSMEQSSCWKGDCCSADQVPCFLWNPNVHCRVDKSWPLVPVLIHMNSVHIRAPYLLKIHFNWLLSWQICLGLPCYLLSSYFIIEILKESFIFLRACYMSRASPPWFYHPNNIWWRVQIMQFSPSFCYVLYLSSKYPLHETR